jgi:hypothetical protein
MRSKHYNIGKNHPGFKKIGYSYDNDGYVRIKISSYKWISEHIYKVKKYLGYKLHKGWIVHHIDGIRNNNKLSNLYIFKSIVEHSSFELLVRKGIIDRFILKSNLKKFKRNI